MEPEIIHVPQLAQLLGRTESSIRSAIQSRPDWLPPFFKQGTRVCWRLETVREFLREYEAGEHKAPKVGRPRQEPPRPVGTEMIQAEGGVMPIEFLSHEEVCELTGAKTKAGQIENLRRNGVRHTIKQNGWPAVTVSAVTGTPEVEEARQRWVSNKAR